MNEHLATSSPPSVEAVNARLASAGPTPRCPSAAVYRDVAAACVPRWFAVTGMAPWLHLCDHTGRQHAAPPGQLLRTVSAAAALGLHARSAGEAGHAFRDHAHAATLIWQSRLAVDGSPARRALRQSPLTAFIASRITQLMIEGEPDDWPMSLDDLDKHLRWLSRRTHRPCWIEAAMIAALADGAILLRQAGLLRHARQRLTALLLRQSFEGWFPEHGGFDVGLHTLTIDALARVFARHNWKELTHPLALALRFLRYFVTPDGSTGGCTSTLGSGFVSPYGVELLAPTHEDAAALARILRHRYARTFATSPVAWSDDLASMLGVPLLLAARHAGDDLDDKYAEPVPGRWLTHFDHARIVVAHTPAYRAVVSTRAGGAMWHWWSHRRTLIEDPGLSVVFPRVLRVSGQADPRNRERVEGASVVCGGQLRRMRSDTQSATTWLGTILHKLLGRKRRQDAPPPLWRDARLLPETQRRSLVNDLFRRAIDFKDEAIDVGDETMTATCCDTIVCQSAMSPNAHPLVDRGSFAAASLEPIYVNGGNHRIIKRRYRDGALDHVEDSSLD